MQQIGKYRITGELGRGGFGVVYRGFDAAVGRDVAIKVLSSQSDPDHIRRFHAEAMTAASFHHKNIVVIHEFGEDNGIQYLVMEYLKGTNLQELIKRKVPLTTLEKLRIMSEVAQGLKCAHEHGVIHRDVKPANIMRLEDRSVKIMDFGIARLLTVEGRLTQAGLVVGTPQYMAPEQFQTGDVDVLCDIWAYGVVLYELLSGINPFFATDAPGIIYRVTLREIDPVAYFLRDCPKLLESMVARLLSRNREDRYQSMEDVVIDLKGVIEDLVHVEVSDLARDAERLIRSDSMDEAQSVIRQILELEPSHAAARKWREEIREHSRQRALQEKVHGLMRDAEAEVFFRNYTAAMEKLTSAANLDPTAEHVKARLAEVRAAKERVDLAAWLLSSARQELEREALTSAFEHATEAAAADPENRDAQTLLQEVRQAISAREIRISRQAQLSKVRGLLVMQAYDEALPILEDLAAKHPGDREIDERLEEVRNLHRAQRDRQKVEAALRQARDLIRAGDYRSAHGLLSDWARSLPDHEQVRSLLQYTAEQAELERIKRESEQALREAAALQNADSDRALSQLERVLALSPGQEDALRMREEILSDRRQEQEDRAIRESIAECRALMDANDLERAAAEVQKLAGQNPQHPDVISFQRDLERCVQAHGDAQVIRQHAQRAESLLDAGQRFDATRLLNDLTARYPGEAAFPELLAKAAAIEKKEREIADEAMREIEKKIEAGEYSSAIQLSQDAASRYATDGRFAVLAERAKAAREFGNRLQTIDELIHANNVEQAAALARSPAPEPRLTAALRQRQSIIEEKKKRQAEFSAADESRKRGEFEKAREIAFHLARTDPHDAAARMLMQQIEEDAAADEKRERKHQMRREAEELRERGEYGDAVERLESATLMFPEDTGLWTELKRTIAARDEYQKRQRYTEGRKQLQAHIARHEFEEAIGQANEMLKQFPGDRSLLDDLDVAKSGNQIRLRRLEADSRIRDLEKLFRQGDAKAVRVKAERLLKDGEEPRARELMIWAERTLQEAAALHGEAKGPSKITRWVLGASIGAAIMVAGVVLVRNHYGGPGMIQANLSELMFSYQQGQPLPPVKTFAMKGAAKNGWAVAATDPWIDAHATDAGVVTVGLTQPLNPGEYSSLVSVSPSGSDAAPATVRVRVSVSAAPPAVVELRPPDSLRRQEVKAESLTKLQSPPTKTIPKADIPQSKPALDATVSEVKQPVQPEPSPPPASPAATAAIEEPIVNCHASDYPGLPNGTIRWSGSLPQNTELTLDRHNRILSGQGGTVRGDRLPGCDVSVTVVSAGTAVVEAPSPANRFARLTLRNTSAAAVTAITIRWEVK